MSSTHNDFGFSQQDVQPGGGWHCSHFFYAFERHAQSSFDSSAVAQFASILNPEAEAAPERLQVGLVSGHKADFSVMIMDPDPIKVESIHQRLLNSEIGRALRTTYSYVSFSEISEYVQSPEQYAARLERDGEDPQSSAFETKVKKYADRLVHMNYNRLTPNFPEWPVSCFYPMNKWRIVDANWFMLTAEERHRLMSEHARSGMKFAGKVSQLITVGIGLDDWEWGVTLWATNPQHLKQIVYDMRFDEASAKYAEFGPFYTSYRATPQQILQTCMGIDAAE